jgi:hypothetical protein
MVNSLKPPDHMLVGVFEAKLASGKVIFRQHREARDVDIAVKLNVLVICAVFAFVGAILLGAF